MKYITVTNTLIATSLRAISLDDKDRNKKENAMHILTDRAAFDRLKQNKYWPKQQQVQMIVKKHMNTRNILKLSRFIRQIKMVSKFNTNLPCIT